MKQGYEYQLMHGRTNIGCGVRLYYDS